MSYIQTLISPLIRSAIYSCIAIQAGGAAAMSDQELCTQVFQKYGVHSHLCPISPAELAAASSPSTGSTPAASTSSSTATDFSIAPTSAVLPDGSGLTQETLESHIFFLSGDAVSDDARVQLAVLVDVLETSVMRSACIRLIGHSDTTGGASGNSQMSQRRAEAVAQILRAGLTDNTRIKDVTFEGEDRPLFGLPGNSVHNRRVEIQAKSCP